MTIGRSPEAEVFLDDVTVSRNHALLVRRRDGLYIDDLGLAERHLREPPPDRVAPARRTATSSRWASTSSPTWTSDEHRGRAGGPAAAQGRRRSRSAPSVKQLEREFPDISISKIRYLEDQKLLSPRRTPGGYRLYAPADVDRLRTILRLQRDEFLPLRVIRQELAAGRADAEVAKASRARSQRGAPRRPSRCAGPGSLYRLDDVLEDTGADRALVKELEDYGVIKGERRDGERSTTTPSARSSAP